MSTCGNLITSEKCAQNGTMSRRTRAVSKEKRRLGREKSARIEAAARTCIANKHGARRAATRGLIPKSRVDSKSRQLKTLKAHTAGTGGASGAAPPMESAAEHAACVREEMDQRRVRSPGPFLTAALDATCAHSVGSCVRLQPEKRSRSAGTGRRCGGVLKLPRLSMFGQPDFACVPRSCQWSPRRRVCGLLRLSTSSLHGCKSGLRAILSPSSAGT